MYNCSYCTHGISFMCRRYMVSADLHSYYNLVRLAKNH